MCSHHEDSDTIFGPVSISVGHCFFSLRHFAHFFLRNFVTKTFQSFVSQLYKNLI